MSLEVSFAHSTRHYTKEQVDQLEIIPRHVAIIMDGNRRWAKQGSFKKVLNTLDGHWQGAHTLDTIVEAASDLNISCLTAYAFSTENWNRSPHEIKTLMQILLDYLRSKRAKMVDEGVKFSVIGDLSQFDQEVRDEIARTQEITRQGAKLRLTLALNYGGRNELARAAQAMAEDYKAGKIEAISERLFSRYLDTGHLPDPDLLIRTSGEMRLSNFLLWQIAYTEVYITERLWPDFSPQDLYDALLEFQTRERRVGR